MSIRINYLKRLVWTTLGLSRRSGMRHLLMPALSGFSVGLLAGAGITLLMRRRSAQNGDENSARPEDFALSEEHDHVWQAHGEGPHTSSRSPRFRPLGLESGNRHGPDLPAPRPAIYSQDETPSRAVIYSAEGGILFSSISPQK